MAVGHTGELRISFVDDELRLVFNQGRLETVEVRQPAAAARGDAIFPDQTFLQLLFSYRTLGDLELAFVDCRARSSKAQTSLTALFPKQLSNWWPVE